MQQYLLLLCTVQVPPLLDGLGQVQLFHLNSDLPDDVVLGKAVKVVDGHHQSLAAHLLEGHLAIQRKWTKKEGIS